MQRAAFLIAAAVIIISRSANAADFSATTQPQTKDIITQLTVKQIKTDIIASTKVWKIELCAQNCSTQPQTFKLVLSAEPHFAASRYLIPGVLYNGNEFVGKYNLNEGRAFSLDMPNGWQKDGQPWIFGGDRSCIPGCTISENKNKVFALFASDADQHSITGSSSLEKLQDGSFRHLIYWPTTEAPVSYTDKRKFTERYDQYITLLPGEKYEVTAYACEGKPKWENFGYTVVFPVAWEVLEHNTPAQKSIAETVDLDLDFMKWTRRKDENGSWFGGGHNDMVFSMGYNGAKSPDGYTIEDYEKDFTLDRWENDNVELSKHLKAGEYIKGSGTRDIGFASQSFQRASLTLEFGLQNCNLHDVEFGADVLHSWIISRQWESGFFRRGTPPKPGSTFTDASEVGWSISELSRTAGFLRSHKAQLEALGFNIVDQRADEFEQSASNVVAAVLKVLPEKGPLGSKWDFSDGKLLSYEGDCGGYVLMGLVRYWGLTGDPSVKTVIDDAFKYYFSRDIDRYECNGGAMDCSSVDREGIQPFLSAAVEMWNATGKKQYLDYARKAGWYFLSWVYIQNPVYGPDLDLSKYNWRPAGSTIVGTEHPGLDDYGNLVIPELMTLAKTDGSKLWREVAALLWRNGTQGFADDDRVFWHTMERPRGCKNEAWFPTRWSKYRTGENKRGSLNDHIMSWGGTYRLAAIMSLSDSDKSWLESESQPQSSVILENKYGRAFVELRGANLRVWKNAAHPERRILGPMGVPMYWPWAVYEGNPGCNIHGLTPYFDWKVLYSDDSSVVLALDDDENTRRIWPHKFHAAMEYRLGETLQIEFRVTNTDDHSYTCTELLHPFFHVSNPSNCHIEGLDGAKYFWKKEPQKGSERVWKGDFPVSMITGGNPGIVFERPDGTFTLVDGKESTTVKYKGTLKFVAYVSNEGETAIEGGTLYKDRAYTLEPAATHTVSAEISLGTSL